MAKKVLVCEDNAMNRVLVRDILASIGCEILEAVNGLQGIEMARDTAPDLIVMDIQMPVMDGYEAIRRLRVEPLTSAIPIIALTSFAMVGDREKVLECGADDYLSKPIDTRVFKALAKKYIDEKKTRDEGGR
ncbi:MAG TPA: response regulator [Rectinemataceae bacterium]|nr:response regulator [Rectinemataceae bacterium]